MAPGLLQSATSEEATVLDAHRDSDDKTSPANVPSHMYFLGRDDVYDVEKPYDMRYEPGDGTRRSNFVHEKNPVEVHSMRKGGPFTLDGCGFQRIDFPSNMQYEDYSDNERIKKIYLQEVRSALKKNLGAKYVHVLDYAVRRRHETFPISTGEDYEYDQPTQLVHIDFTRRESERIIKVLFGDRADEVLAGRWQAVNVWKPMKGPLNDWPLAVCDARSVDFEVDAMPTDIVFPEFVTENIQLAHNPNQRWYYLPDHRIDEALLFKSADSELCEAPATPHTGFYNPNVKPGERRESLDARCFVFYADLEKYPPVVGNVFHRHA